MSRPIKTLTLEQIVKLLNRLATPAAFKHSQDIARRNHLIGQLMLDAGLRVGELVQLVRGDLYANGQPVPTLLIRGEISKGKRERSIPTSFGLKMAIDTIARNHWHPGENPTTTPVFTRIGSYNRLSTRQVENIIGFAAEAALGVWISPHVLRHTFASRLMRTTNIRIVQELLGHKNLSSTQIYTHPNSNDLRKAIDSMNE